MNGMNQENKDDLTTSDVPHVLLSDEAWSEIKLEGGLHENVRGSLILEIIMYRRKRVAGLTVRRRIEQVRGVLFKTCGLLSELIENDEFLTIGVDGKSAPDIDLIVEWLNVSAKVFEEMDRADARFEIAPQRAIFPEYGALEDFVFGVLMLQAKSLNRAPPISWRNSSANPRFEKYVYLCSQAADPTLEADFPTLRNKKIDRALKQAVASYKFVRDEDPENWAKNWKLDSSQEKKGG